MQNKLLRFGNFLKIWGKNIQKILDMITIMKINSSLKNPMFMSRKFALCKEF